MLLMGSSWASQGSPSSLLSYIFLTPATSALHRSFQKLKFYRPLLYTSQQESPGAPSVESPQTAADHCPIWPSSLIGHTGNRSGTKRGPMTCALDSVRLRLCISSLRQGATKIKLSHSSCFGCEVGVGKLRMVWDLSSSSLWLCEMNRIIEPL